MTTWSWSTDFTNFTDAAGAHTTAVTNLQNDDTSYKDKVAQFEAFIKSHSAGEGLNFFFYWIATCTDPNQKDNILGLYDDQTVILGKGLSVSGKNTTLSTDLQNLFNDTISTDSVPINQQCAVADSSLTALIDKFQNDPDVVNSFDPSTRSGIIQQLQAMQSNLHQYFTWTDSSGHQQGSGTLTSFDDMKNQMSGKDPGDATAAAKAFTDASQTLTSETQNFNAAMNQQVSAATGIEKNWQSAIGSFMKSVNDLMSAIIQNQTKA